MTGFYKYLSAFVMILAFSLGCAQSPKDPATGEVTVYLVRHAEKVLDVSNPPLNEAGVERAQELATYFAGRELTHIHSTDFLRTLQTAEPTSAMLGLQVELYDPRDLTAFAARLKQTPGIHLVVGHSNTTPQLVAALGGEPGTEINEAAEYDRLYIVELSAPGEVQSTLMRYGTAYVPG